MNKRTIIGVVFFSLFAGPLSASAIAASLGQLERELDEGDKIPPELRYTPMPPTQPISAVWYEGTEDDLSSVLHLKTDDKGVHLDIFSLCANWQESTRREHPQIECDDQSETDATGLISTYQHIKSDSNEVANRTTDRHLKKFSMVGALTDPHSVTFEAKTTELWETSWIFSQRLPDEFLTQVEFDCLYKSIDANTVGSDCSSSFESVARSKTAHDNSGRNPSQHTMYYWWPRFGIYLPIQPHDLMDIKVGDGPWQSQIDAKGVSDVRKAQANALFAKGFDLYKSGDFAAAKALLVAGLRIDKTNFQAWSALGDSYNSQYKIETKYSQIFGAIRCYQRVLDFAPDSVEGLTAKAHLDALGMKYEAMGSAP